MRLWRELDVASTYANIITSANLDGAAIPMVMNNDREAISLAVKTVVRVKPQDCRIVRIRTRCTCPRSRCRSRCWPKSRAHPERFEVMEKPHAWTFDAQGNLAPLTGEMVAAA